MKKNVGKIDRIIRLVLGAALAVAGLSYQNWLLIVIGAVLFATGLVGWCGLYSVFGISTCPVELRKNEEKTEPKNQEN